jgi:hypothetical protein
MSTIDKLKRSTSSGDSTEITPDQKLKFKIFRKMIRRVLQDLYSSENKIREDAEEFVQSKSFCDLIEMSGLKSGYQRAAQEIQYLSLIQRKAVIRKMLKAL